MYSLFPVSSVWYCSNYHPISIIALYSDAQPIITHFQIKREDVSFQCRRTKKWHSALTYQQTLSGLPRLLLLQSVEPLLLEENVLPIYRLYQRFLRNGKCVLWEAMRQKA